MPTTHDYLGMFITTLRDAGHSAAEVKSALQSFAGMQIAGHDQRQPMTTTLRCDAGKLFTRPPSPPSADTDELALAAAGKIMTQFSNEGASLSGLNTGKLKALVQCIVQQAHQAAVPKELVMVARVDDLERGGRRRALALNLGLDVPLYAVTQEETPGDK